MDFKVSNDDFRFKVENTFSAEIPLCKCKNEKVSAVAMPCGHSLCSKNLKNKKCPKCNKNIEKIEKFYDLYPEI